MRCRKVNIFCSVSRNTVLGLVYHLYAQIRQYLWYHPRIVNIESAYSNDDVQHSDTLHGMPIQAQNVFGQEFAHLVPQGSPDQQTASTVAIKDLVRNLPSVSIHKSSNYQDSSHLSFIATQQTASFVNTPAAPVTRRSTSSGSSVQAIRPTGAATQQKLAQADDSPEEMVTVESKVTSALQPVSVRKPADLPLVGQATQLLPCEELEPNEQPSAHYNEDILVGSGFQGLATQSDDKSVAFSCANEPRNQAQAAAASQDVPGDGLKGALDQSQVSIKLQEIHPARPQDPTSDHVDVGNFHAYPKALPSWPQPAISAASSVSPQLGCRPSLFDTLQETLNNEAAYYEASSPNSTRVPDASSQVKPVFPRQKAHTSLPSTSKSQTGKVPMPKECFFVKRSVEHASAQFQASIKVRNGWQGCSICSDISDGSARSSFRSSGSGSGSAHHSSRRPESRKSGAARCKPQLSGDKESEASRQKVEQVDLMTAQLQELAAKRLGLSDPTLLQEIMKAHPAVQSLLVQQLSTSNSGMLEPGTKNMELVDGIATQGDWGSIRNLLFRDRLHDTSLPSTQSFGDHYPEEGYLPGYSSRQRTPPASSPSQPVDNAEELASIEQEVANNNTATHESTTDVERGLLNPGSRAPGIFGKSTSGKLQLDGSKWARQARSHSIQGQFLGKQHAVGARPRSQTIAEGLQVAVAEEPTHSKKLLAQTTQQAVTDGWKAEEGTILVAIEKDLSHSSSQTWPRTASRKLEQTPGQISAKTGPTSPLIDHPDLVPIAQVPLREYSWGEGVYAHPKQPIASVKDVESSSDQQLLTTNLSCPIQPQHQGADPWLESEHSVAHSPQSTQVVASSSDQLDSTAQPGSTMEMPVLQSSMLPQLSSNPSRDPEHNNVATSNLTVQGMMLSTADLNQIAALAGDVESKVPAFSNLSNTLRVAIQLLMQLPHSSMEHGIISNAKELAFAKQVPPATTLMMPAATTAGSHSKSQLPALSITNDAKQEYIQSVDELEQCASEGAEQCLPTGMQDDVKQQSSGEIWEGMGSDSPQDIQHMLPREELNDPDSGDYVHLPTGVAASQLAQFAARLQRPPTSLDVVFECEHEGETASSHGSLEPNSAAAQIPDISSTLPESISLKPITQRPAQELHLFKSSPEQLDKEVSKDEPLATIVGAPQNSRISQDSDARQDSSEGRQSSLAESFPQDDSASERLTQGSLVAHSNVEQQNFIAQTTDWEGETVWSIEQYSKLQSRLQTSKPDPWQPGNKEAAEVATSQRSRSASSRVQPVRQESFVKTGVHKRTASGASSSYLNRLLSAQIATASWRSATLRQQPPTAPQLAEPEPRFVDTNQPSTGLPESQSHNGTPLLLDDATIHQPACETRQPETRIAQNQDQSTQPFDCRDQQPEEKLQSPTDSSSLLQPRHATAGATPLQQLSPCVSCPRDNLLEEQTQQSGAVPTSSIATNEKHAANNVADDTSPRIEQDSQRRTPSASMSQSPMLPDVQLSYQTVNFRASEQPHSHNIAELLPQETNTGQLLAGSFGQRASSVGHGSSQSTSLPHSKGSTYTQQPSSDRQQPTPPLEMSSNQPQSPDQGNMPQQVWRSTTSEADSLATVIVSPSLRGSDTHYEAANSNACPGKSVGLQDGPSAPLYPRQLHRQGSDSLEGALATYVLSEHSQRMQQSSIDLSRAQHIQLTHAALAHETTPQRAACHGSSNASQLPTPEPRGELVHNGALHLQNPQHGFMQPTHVSQVGSFPQFGEHKSQMQVAQPSYPVAYNVLQDHTGGADYGGTQQLPSSPYWKEAVRSYFPQPPARFGPFDRELAFGKAIHQEQARGHMALVAPGQLTVRRGSDVEMQQQAADHKAGHARSATWDPNWAGLQASAKDEYSIQRVMKQPAQRGLMTQVYQHKINKGRSPLRNTNQISSSGLSSSFFAAVDASDLQQSQYGVISTAQFDHVRQSSHQQ